MSTLAAVRALALVVVSAVSLGGQQPAATQTKSVKPQAAATKPLTAEQQAARDQRKALAADAKQQKAALKKAKAAHDTTKAAAAQAALKADAAKRKELKAAAGDKTDKKKEKPVTKKP